MDLSVKLYMAARFTRREELESYAPLIQDAGFEITSTWVFGGEDGLTRQDIAELDIRDVERADAILLFTEPYGEHIPGGGRFVEFGYAIGRGKKLFVIGGRENVFMHYPGVEFYMNVHEFARSHKRV